MQKRFFCFCFFVLSLLRVCFSEEKRALIIGINDYYYQDGKTKEILRDPNNSLKGCINDAKSIKELIISRFGFKQESIKELYSGQATKKNILLELDKLLAISKPGDNAFFYYSGHGLQMPDASGNSTDEAIAPTDVLYQKNGYILSLQLAAIFNKFVDKKVTLTTIFDCCHSWGTKKVLVKTGDTYVVEKHSNVGSGPIIGTNNAGNGNTDFETLALPELQNTDDATAGIKELNLYDFKLYTEGLTDTAYTTNVEDEKFLTGIKKDNGVAVTSKLLGENISVPVGPAKRVNSNFLFLSATDDDQKAMEKWDESLTKHGVFTKALIEVFKKNPATLSSQQIFDKVNAELKKRNYTQTPTLRSAPERKTKNLLSVSPLTIKNDVFTTCIASNNGSITFDKGAQAGILKGNVLQDISNPAVKAEVQSFSGENNAVATIVSGTPVVGHTFKVISWYVKSSPVLKVYLPVNNFTFPELMTFFNKNLKALVGEQSAAGTYSGFGNCLSFEETGRCSKIYVTSKNITYINSKTHETKNIPDITKTTIQTVNGNTTYFVYLPIPSEVSMALEALCKKDQNIQLVDDPAQADVSFYCAYTQTITESKDIAGKPAKPAGENNVSVLDYLTQNSSENSYQFPQLNQPTISKKKGYNLVLAFSKETVGAEQNTNSHSPLAPFIFIEKGTVLSVNEAANKMYSWLTYTASKRGVWLNGWAKK